MNELFQNAMKRVPQKTPPIWMMRQAGRYHSHYRAIREKHSFDEMCRTPELAAEVAMGPIQDFDFDLAILFSDILYPLDALGMGLKYTEEGPRLHFQLNEENISKLASVEEAFPHLLFQGQVVKETRKVLPKNKSLIGFVGGPWTMFVYAVEGSHAGTLIQSKKSVQLINKFFKILIPLMEKNIQNQLDNGAEIVMIFDTAAGALSPASFQSWVQPVLATLANKFPNKIGYYSRETQKSFFNSEFLALPFVGMGFDHRWNLNDCFGLKKTGFVQGNFDQSLLFQEGDDFKKSVQMYVENLKKLSPEERAGWVSGLGHGVLPKTPEKNVHQFIETIRGVFK